MISKKELMERICDLEFECVGYEEDIRDLQLKVKKLEPKKVAKKTTKKVVKK